MSLDVKHFMKHLYLKMHSSVLYSFREMVSSMWAGANLRKILNVCSCWLFSELLPNVEALKRIVQVSLRAPLSSHKTSPGMLSISMLDLYFHYGRIEQPSLLFIDGRSMTPLLPAAQWLGLTMVWVGNLVLVVRQTIGCLFDYFWVSC